MKHTSIWALVVLNVLLLAALVGRVSSSNAAHAQAQARQQRPGDYLMIPGEVSGGSSAVVYVIDTTNGWLGALAYDDAIKRMQAMPGKIDLAQVFQQANANPPRTEKPRRGY